MKKLTLLVLFVSVCVVVFGTSVAEAQKKKGMMKEAMLWPAENIKWQAMGAEFPGVLVATLWGDPTKGGYGSLLNVPAGFKLGLHHHTNTIKGVVISGTMIIGMEDGKEVTLGPGSYLYMPKGMKHTTSVGGDAPCVFFEESNDKEGTVVAAQEPMMKK